MDFCWLHQAQLSVTCWNQGFATLEMDGIPEK
jgi:hypothetical protein